MEARRATLADVDELLRLANVMLDAVGMGSDDPAWETDARLRLHTGFADDSVAAFVVDHPTIGHRCVASAAVSLQLRLPTPGNPGGRVSYVQWVATDPEFRRQGCARVVMESVVAWSLAHDVGSVDLHASPDGAPLYRDLGFAPAPNPELRRFTVR
jgi:GNAT superfamily N-acetyltransferase